VMFFYVMFFYVMFFYVMHIDADADSLT